MQDSNHIINEVTSGDYKYGFVTDIDTEVIHRGLDEETVRIICQEERAGMVTRVPFEGFSPLADVGDAYMASLEYPADRLSGHYLLCRP